MTMPPLIFKVIGRAIVLPTLVVGLLALGVWFSSGNALSAGDGLLDKDII